MRTGDVARLAGCSVQQVRRLERVGAVPPAERTASGYRVYGERHLRSVLAYRALTLGIGPTQAQELMTGVHTWPVDQVLGVLDGAHAQLDAERRVLDAARSAAGVISADPVTDARPSDAMGVAELADALGVRPSTLRHWDAVGLVTPDRDVRGHRLYRPHQVRDARLVHQLRLAAYGVELLADVLPQVRGAGGAPELSAALAARDRSITARSLALLEASTHLAALLTPGRL